MLKILPIIFFPEFPKKFSYYSFFILVSSLLLQNNAHFSNNNAHLVSVAIVT